MSSVSKSCVPLDRDKGDASEWEVFKTAIDLRAYASHCGYRLDIKRSWRGSAVMRSENGDKIIISRQGDGHYVYWSVHNENDRGTVIDFVKHRQPKPNLAQVRNELRAFMGLSGNIECEALPALQKTNDRRQIQEHYRHMHIAHSHPYLERERFIPALLLQYWRFEGTILIDRRGNAVFPHHDTDGLCGYEIKNNGFTSFSPGGTKGLWRSKTASGDKRLVICESAIDALSFAVLFDDGLTRYASIAGKPTPIQLNLIRVQIECTAPQSEIVAAMDADPPGTRLIQSIREAFQEAARGDVTFRSEQPFGFKDWNEQLKAARIHIRRSDLTGVRR